MQNALSYAWYFDQIFIVDNTEGDNSSLAAQIPNAIYIPNGKNLGIAKALNQGIEAALSENTKGRDYRWGMTMDQDSAWDKEQLVQYISACIEMNGQDAASTTGGGWVNQARTAYLDVRTTRGSGGEGLGHRKLWRL